MLILSYMGLIFQIQISELSIEEYELDNSSGYIVDGVYPVYPAFGIISGFYKLTLDLCMLASS